MFTNLKNGKRYIGSYENLTRRFREYFNTNYLIKNNYMAICCALLKHDFSNFSLTIIEYCEKKKCLEREDDYFKLLKPEYNIANNPTSPMSGRTHSEKSKQKISDTKKGSNPSDETRKKMSDAKKGKTHNEKTRAKISDARKGQPRAEGAGKPSQLIEVLNEETNQTTNYNSIYEAARALNINHTVIVKYFSRNQKKPYKGVYTFKKS
jgi:group I intron endonuclease